MPASRISLISPTGALGMGFLDQSLERGISLKPDVIACDAGSTDSGPFYLGSGTPKMSRFAILHDLRRLLSARDRLNVPLIIGSCGTSGVDSAVDWMRELALEIASEDGLKFKLGRVYSEQNPEIMADAFKSGKIEALPGASELDEQTILNCSHIVAMMGHEPIVYLLENKCDVILCGRASDTALFAAVPLMRGFIPGPVWHCAKTIECGAICSTITRADGVYAEIDENGFSVEPLALDASCTPLSLASHTLYENADPFLIREPSGTLDTQNANYHAVSERKTRVEGSVFRPERYTLKMEGTTLSGFQTIAIGGVRDPYILARIETWLAEMRVFFKERLKELTGKTLGEEVRLDISQYGRNAVMGELEPVPEEMPHEIGLLFTITAPDQTLANDVARFVTHAASHWPIPEWDGFISGIAFPFSPPEIDRGPTYRFTLNHVLIPESPISAFRFEMENIR
ncbi:MAG: DUF1446 domain-containing protein [SAR324 cluster bacterium]|nr:DUF1446 domain-containing protein [SAR324 cluster bacterium]